MKSIAGMLMATLALSWLVAGIAADAVIGLSPSGSEHITVYAEPNAKSATEQMPEMQAYLDSLLARIKRQAGVPEWPGSVHILAFSTLDAYATAAGNIYISQSWLSSASSEDEVVGVLSHEFAHVYLHYHKLDEVVPATDKATQLASAGATLVMQMTGTGGQGWTDVDSLVAGYTVGRDLLSTAWGRSQESSADLLGLNISLRLGYSYDAGYKAFLARLDRLTLAMDELPPEDLQFDATTKPWRQALAQRRTAATLRNYQMAVQAVTQLDNPKALTWARLDQLCHAQPGIVERGTSRACAGCAKSGF